MQRPIGIQLLALALAFVACFGVAAIGAAASVGAPAFYGALVQPAWSPPAWLFGPVWTVLYATMAVAAWLVWREPTAPDGVKRRDRRRVVALGLFVAQLVANALWSWLFFAWRLGAWSFVEIVVLWVLIVATIVAFWRVRPVAGALLLPYLGWVTFAAALNWSLWTANRDVLG